MPARRRGAGGGRTNVEQATRQGQAARSWKRSVGACLAALATAGAEGVAGVDGVHTTYVSEDGTSVGVVWFSGQADHPFVRFGMASGLLTNTSAAEVAPFGSGVVCRARITGLPPGTACRYRCVAAPGDEGPVGGFKTAPVAGSPVTFAVLGDIQVTGSDTRWRAMAAWLARRDLDFCLAVGDQVDRGLQPEQWPALFAGGAPLFEKTVVMPCVGNHECYGTALGREQMPELYLKAFGLPDNGVAGFSGQWYAFRAGVVGLSVLTTYPFRSGTLGDPRAVPEQTEWLDATLARQPPPMWSLVACHAPLHSSGPHGGDTDWLDALWGRLFETRGVAAVFSGHTHAFEVTEPLVRGVAVGSGQGGVTYYNTAGVSYSATATGSQVTSAYQKQEREPLVLWVRADARSVALETWDVGEDRVRDRREVRR